MADRIGIELARVGEFDLAVGGKQSFTPEMLSDAARRATEQGSKFRAPLKLGHSDPRNDGEPAMGWLHNLRVEGTGADSVLLGDVTGMPAWLAETAPSAYPDRSIEGNVIEAADGDKGLNITALALLGVTPPAMADLKSWRELPGFIAAAAELPLTAFAAAYEAIRDLPQAPAEPPVIPPNTQKGVSVMETLIQGLRERFGFADDADEATILAAVDVARDPAVTPETIAAAYKLLPEQVTTALAAAAKPAQEPKLPEGMVVLSKDQLDELRIAAASGAEARAKQLTDERDDTIKTAIAAGKIAPARREHWATNWDKDPEGTKSSIGELQVLYPIAASGHAGSGSESRDAELSDDDASALASIFGGPKEAYGV